MSKITIQKSKSAQIKGEVKTYEGKTGADIREYIQSDKYAGPTKAGLWIPIEKWDEFKKMVADMDKEVQDLKALNAEMKASVAAQTAAKAAV